MGPVAYFSLCLLGCLIFNPSMAAPSLSAGAQAEPCPKDWLSFHSTCYGFFEQEKTWMEAEVHCQHERHGAHLASIHSDVENKVLAHYIKQKYKKIHAVWIGLTDPKKNQCWRWSDNSLLSFANWEDGQPQRSKPDENCAGSSPDSDFKKWHDYPCEDRHPFICEHKP
ncbi:C-type lectin lectoxin-Enh4-like [Mauremys reevesii]|uniref:C-type lectin lectoxin-Enh4-like n=1 Tax=Mauremys reevesii TaxID=260615 RepID=UPI00193FE065|nr:C-type lectin lectoxin-Enh4-like [Mauremys reevesii]